ncbi:MarR family winged helix-turn-helix transcriptional regulator [Bacillus sp. 03113]|uniref:MarR family winged helix-turn-helix transcriptional regulator n=1 Tax=Bacillus sp. 03113 TaxID=2578211 RepID=UPI001142022A|nr:MarR family transcriptional regulator [Bacillus sp. 03113]
MEKQDYIARIQAAFQITFQKMQPELHESMNEQGITPSQLFVLIFLKKGGSCKVTQLAEKLDVKPSAATTMVDRLVQNEFVIREHDQKDRRVVNISITKRGEEKLDKVFEARKAIVRKYLAYLSEEELSSMAAIAEKLASSITEEF